MSATAHGCGIWRSKDLVSLGTYLNNKTFPLDSASVKRFGLSLCKNADLLAPLVKTTDNQSPLISYHYAVDRDGRLFILVTDKAFPTGLAYQFLEELIDKFLAKHDEKSLACSKNGLKSSIKEIFTVMSKKYDDVIAQDKIHKIHQQVDMVKITMSENIQTALSAVATTEQLADTSEELRTNAEVFKKKGKELNDKMWWRNCKEAMMLASFIVIILGVSIGLLVYHFKKKHHSSSPPPVYSPMPPTSSTTASATTSFGGW